MFFFSQMLEAVLRSGELNVLEAVLRCVFLRGKLNVL